MRRTRAWLRHHSKLHPHLAGPAVWRLYLSPAEDARDRLSLLPRHFGQLFAALPEIACAFAQGFDRVAGALIFALHVLAQLFAALGCGQQAGQRSKAKPNRHEAECGGVIFAASKKLRFSKTEVRHKRSAE